MDSMEERITEPSRRIKQEDAEVSNIYYDKRVYDEQRR